MWRKKNDSSFWGLIDRMGDDINLTNASSFLKGKQRGDVDFTLIHLRKSRDFQ